ncbi:MAG: DUF3570 domain-containing protein, partial [Myxococcota bacterium]
MTRRFVPCRGTLIATLVGTLAAASPAAAGINDQPASELAQRSMDRDLSDKREQVKAKQMVAFAKVKCGVYCGEKAKAELALAEAVRLSYEGKDEKAQRLFTKAINDDGDVVLPERHAGPNSPAARNLAIAKGESVPPAGSPDDKPPPEEEKKPDEKKEPKAKKKKESKPESSDEDDEIGGGSTIEATVGLEVTGYMDDNSVEVNNPGVMVNIEDPVNGWGVNASLAVDVLTAASPDIVSMASPKWQDERIAPAIGGHVKVDNWDISLSGNMSIESDYFAYGGSVGVAVETLNKQLVPSLTYSYGHDTAGRAGTPFDVYRLDLDRHGIIAAFSIVMSKRALMVPSLTYVFETGRQEKPYRYIPLFEPNVEIENGESIESVNEQRTPVRMEERLPTTRHRFAPAVLFAYRFDGFTLRVTERLYADSWRQVATTSDFRLPIDLGDDFRITPHARFHAQSGTAFWERAYRGARLASGPYIQPNFRTGDRELGPLMNATGGLG